MAQEYAVCALAQDFARRLTQVGAPASLIEGGLLMALDELEHAVLAQEAAEAAGAAGLVDFDPDAFRLYRSEDPITDLTMMATCNLALGETLAVRVSHGLRENARVPVAVAALERVVSDEPRHAALGWQTLDWLLEHTREEDVRGTISTHLETWVSDYQAGFVGDRPEPHLVGLADEDLAWGLATLEFHRDSFERTLSSDWVPRLARRGFSPVGPCSGAAWVGPRGQGAAGPRGGEGAGCACPDPAACLCGAARPGWPG